MSSDKNLATSAIEKLGSVDKIEKNLKVSDRKST